MKPEKKRTDYRACPYTLVRECGFDEYGLNERPCEKCLLAKLENHLFKLKKSQEELVNLYKKKDLEIK